MIHTKQRQEHHAFTETQKLKRNAIGMWLEEVATVKSTSKKPGLTQDAKDPHKNL